MPKSLNLKSVSPVPAGATDPNLLAEAFWAAPGAPLTSYNPDSPDSLSSVIRVKTGAVPAGAELALRDKGVIEIEAVDSATASARDVLKAETCDPTKLTQFDYITAEPVIVVPTPLRVKGRPRITADPLPTAGTPVGGQIPGNQPTGGSSRRIRVTLDGGDITIRG
jgi:hypothetical protein